jgi:hypothetical protein
MYLHLETQFFIIMQKNNKATEVVIKYSDLDASRISSTDLEENDRSKGQKIAYPRYDHPTLGPDQRIYIQFPHVKLVTYGVPRAGEYYQTENARAFIKLPLDLALPEVQTLVEKMKAIDAHFSSQEFAEKLLGKKWNKYTYQSIFREVIVDEDDDQKSKPKGKYEAKPKYPYMKLKLDTEYDTDKVITKTYRTDTINGEKKRTEVSPFENLDDFTKLVSWQSTIRPIAMMTKFWVQPITNKNPSWGVTFKVKKMEVEPAQKSSGSNSFMNSDAFLDSDDEESELVQAKPVKAVVQAKVVAQVESDDDEEEEEEEKPKATVVAKKVVAAVESDDDSEESEEEKPVVKAKPAAKATRGGKGGKTATA